MKYERKSNKGIHGHCRTTIPKPCPGLYCGRIYSNGVYSGCGACPWGYRANLSICVPCDTELPAYDSFYLLTVVLMTVLLHFYFIDKSVKLAYRKKPQVMILYLSAIAESSLSVLISMFLYNPFGSLKLTGCGVKQLSDFYTVFKNPRPNYEEKLYCTQEAAYPIYSIVLVYICLSILAILIIRIPLVGIFRIRRDSANSIYAAFYFFPIMAAFYAVLAGYLCKYFSYKFMVSSIISKKGSVPFLINLLISQLDQNTIDDILIIITKLSHCFIFSFDVVSITDCLTLVDSFPNLTYGFTHYITMTRTRDIVICKDEKLATVNYYLQHLVSLPGKLVIFRSYYSYPVLMLIGAVVSTAWFLASRPYQVSKC
nr:EOG090X0BGA [Artemia franciscana]